MGAWASAGASPSSTAPSARPCPSQKDASARRRTPHGISPRAPLRRERAFAHDRVPVTGQRQAPLGAETPQRMEVLADAPLFFERDPVPVFLIGVAQDAPVDAHRMRRSIAPLMGLSVPGYLTSCSLRWRSRSAHRLSTFASIRSSSSSADLAGMPARWRSLISLRCRWSWRRMRSISARRKGRLGICILAQESSRDKNEKGT